MFDTDLREKYLRLLVMLQGRQKCCVEREARAVFGVEGKVVQPTGVLKVECHGGHASEERAPDFCVLRRPSKVSLVNKKLAILQLARHRQPALLILGQTVSNFGDGVALVALTLLVLDTTHSVS